MYIPSAKHEFFFSCCVYNIEYEVYKKSSATIRIFLKKMFHNLYKLDAAVMIFVKWLSLFSLIIIMDKMSQYNHTKNLALFVRTELHSHQFCCINF